MLVSKKIFVQTICFSWQAEYIIQHPWPLVPINSVYAGDSGKKRMKRCSKERVCWQAGMGLWVEGLSHVLLWKSLSCVCIKLLTPCVLVGYEFLKKLQTGLSNRAYRLGTDREKRDQNGVGQQFILGNRKK